MPEDLLTAFFEQHAPPDRALELGDPGTVIDGGTPRSALPPYEGPPEPAARHEHEWGAPAADQADDAPVPGPTIARYPSAG
jgi:hypothetical protein